MIRPKGKVIKICIRCGARFMVPTAFRKKNMSKVCLKCDTRTSITKNYKEMIEE